MTEELGTEFLRKVSEGIIVMDACNLSRFYEKNSKHRLQKKDSSSDSVVAFSEHNLKSFGKTAVKLFLSLPKNSGLLYETSVYKMVLDEIVANGSSPNFVPYLASGTCLLSNMRTIFTPNEFQKIKEYFDAQKDQQFTDHYGLAQDFGVEILVTGAPRKPRNVFDCIREGINEDDTKKIILQLLCALSTMEDKKLIHNDLYAGNVLVSTEKKAVTLNYSVEYEGQTRNFQVRTKYVVYIFDWDRSYSEMLGPNTSLDDRDNGFCQGFNQCNVFDPKADLFTFFCSIEGFGAQAGNDFLEKVVSTFIDTEIFRRTRPNSIEGKIILTDEQKQRLFKHVPTQTYGARRHGGGIVNYSFYDLSMEEARDVTDYFQADIFNDIDRLKFRYNITEGYIIIRVEDNALCRPLIVDSKYPSAKEVLFYKGEWKNRCSLAFWTEMFGNFLSGNQPDEVDVYGTRTPLLRRTATYIRPVETTYLPSWKQEVKVDMNKIIPLMLFRYNLATQLLENLRVTNNVDFFFDICCLADKYVSMLETPDWTDYFYGFHVAKLLNIPNSKIDNTPGIDFDKIAKVNVTMKKFGSPKFSSLYSRVVDFYSQNRKKLSVDDYVVLVYAFLYTSAYFANSFELYMTDPRKLVLPSPIIDKNRFDKAMESAERLYNSLAGISSMDNYGGEEKTPFEPQTPQIPKPSVYSTSPVGRPTILRKRRVKPKVVEQNYVTESVYPDVAKRKKQSTPGR
jgi:serine/threonine protein kinase